MTFYSKGTSDNKEIINTVHYGSKIILRLLSPFFLLDLFKSLVWLVDRRSLIKQENYNILSFLKCLRMHCILFVRWDYLNTKQCITYTYIPNRGSCQSDILCNSSPRKGRYMFIFKPYHIDFFLSKRSVYMPELESKNKYTS